MPRKLTPKNSADFFGPFLPICRTRLDCCFIEGLRKVVQKTMQVWLDIRHEEIEVCKRMSSAQNLEK